MQDQQLATLAAATKYMPVKKPRLQWSVATPESHTCNYDQQVQLTQVHHPLQRNMSCAPWQVKLEQLLQLQQSLITTLTATVSPIEPGTAT